MTLAWIYLLIAGAFEITWALGLKYTDGFTRLWPSVFTVVMMILSFLFLARALREIPVGTGYAVWTGIGVMGTTAVGIWLFGEAVTVARLVCLAMIFTGIVGLKLFTAA